MNVGQHKRKLARARRRRLRVRRRIHGGAARPRLTVSRSLRHLYAQIVDDEAGRTLLGLSSRAVGLEPGDDKRTQSEKLGAVVAAKAKELGIEAVVFDRDRYPYHGRIRKFADGARKGGLKF